MIEWIKKLFGRLIGKKPNPFPEIDPSMIPPKE